jgi:activator of HSP90 ATPase
MDAGAQDLYEALTMEARVRAFTQSEATVSGQEGGEFSMFGGSVHGVQRKLVPGKRIVQDWRFNTWPDGTFSQVRALACRRPGSPPS